ncbi:hypothetical protein [Eikenella corrodens]|uniref:hypothetical protein n=1 Tax=Eikenella corrodens TaxID=539 RepID=UPI001F49F5E0|nr:hypothetical protein [Eikenella corrodens]
MKIISKFKDFYDHKVAKYGIDPVLVFDRRQSPEAEILRSLPKPPTEWKKEYGACAVVSELYIGNLRVFLFAAEKQVYSSYDIDTVYLQHRRHRFSLSMVRFLDGSEYCLPQCHNYYWPGYRHFQTPDFSPRRCSRRHPIIANTAIRRCYSPITPTQTGPPGSTAAKILPKTRSSPASACISTPISCGSIFANTSHSSKARPKPARPCQTKTKSATKASMPSIRSDRK